MNDCMLKSIGRCTNPDQKLQEAGADRIKSIIHASRIYDDDFHISLEAQAQNEAFTAHYHKNCVSTYVSKHHLQRFLKSGKAEHNEYPDPPAKRTRSSISESVFNFKKHCLFCGEECVTDVDPKHPERW